MPRIKSVIKTPSAARPASGSKRGSAREITARRRKLAAAVAIPSLPYRAQQGGLDAPVPPLSDATGKTGHPAARAVDVIATLARRGTLDEDMLAAARQFEADYHKAHLSGYAQGQPFALVTSGTGRRRKAGARKAGDLAEHTHAARDRLWRALTLLGGAESPAARVVWAVAAENRTLKDFATRSAWTHNQKLNPMTATGHLQAGLTVLAQYYQGRLRVRKTS